MTNNDNLMMNSIRHLVRNYILKFNFFASGTMTNFTAFPENLYMHNIHLMSFGS